MIISKFKDYYDYLGQIYGIDNTFAYKRELYNKNKALLTIPAKKLNIPHIWVHTTSRYKPCYIIITGRIFLLYYITDKKSLISYNINDYKLYLGDEKEINDKFGINRKYKYFPNITSDEVNGNIINVNALNFCISQKCPIITLFTNTHNYYYSLSSPILGDISKFASIYPAEKIYAELEYFFLNQINGSPDIDPPVQIPETIRIESKGFDLKRSFRPSMK